MASKWTNRAVWILWLAALALRESWEAIVSLLLAAIGISPEAILIWLFGPDYSPQITNFVASDWFPRIIYGAALIFMGRWVYKRFYTHEVLSEKLRGALADLNSDNVHLRINAVHEILDISRRSKRLHDRAISALTNFLKEHYPAPEEEGRSVTVRKQKYGLPSAESSQEYGSDIHDFVNKEIKATKRQLNPDAAAALEALAGRKTFFDNPRMWIDLSRTDLPAANLEHTNLKRFSFTGANLRGANFSEANLEQASFASAIVNEAFFTKANLKKSSFHGALAIKANFDKANLQEATFIGAMLYDAMIQSANAKKAYFLGAYMWRVTAGMTDFKGAVFGSTNLEGASLHEAKNLTKEQIDSEFSMNRLDKARLPWHTDEELRKLGVIKFNSGKT